MDVWRRMCKFYDLNPHTNIPCVFEVYSKEQAAGFLAYMLSGTNFSDTERFKELVNNGHEDDAYHYTCRAWLEAGINPAPEKFEEFLKFALRDLFTSDSVNTIEQYQVKDFIDDLPKEKLIEYANRFAEWIRRTN